MALTLRGTDVLILVDRGHSSEPHVRAMGEWLETVRPGKYNVDFSADLSPNVLDSSPSLSVDQIQLLESYDLILMPRHGPGGSGDFASTDWNDITTPMLIQNPFTVRNTNWHWVPIGDEATTTESFLEMIVADEANPIFDGLDVSAGEAIWMTHLPEGIMQVEVPSDQLTGSVLAWTPRFDNGNNLEYPWIVHWDGTEESFYDGGSEAPGGPRMLFLEQLRSSKAEYRSEAQQIFLNAVSILTTGESDPVDLPPDVVRNEPVPPASGVDILVLTDVGDEDAASHIALADFLEGYFPNSQVIRSSEYVTGGEALSGAQMTELAGYDLIVMPPGVSAQAYNTFDWNEGVTPLLNLNYDYQRRSVEVDGEWTAGWSWFASTSTGVTEAVQNMSVRNWASTDYGYPHAVHPIFSGIDFSGGPVIQVYEEPVDTTRINTTPAFIFGDFLGSVEQHAIRSILTVWQGGESFGRFDDDGVETFLPAPAGARGQFLMPGGDGEVGDLTEAGAQLLRNTANWLIGEGGVVGHVSESFEWYPVPPGQDSVRFSHVPLMAWEALGSDPVPWIHRGYHAGGVAPNKGYAMVDNSGFEPTSIWRRMGTPVVVNGGAPSIDWSFRVRLEDPDLEDAGVIFALGEDTGEADAGDNMRNGNVAAIRLVQNGAAREFQYVGTGGGGTVLDGLAVRGWYEVSAILDLVEETYSVRVASVDGTEEGTVDDIPFLGSAEQLDYFTMYSEEGSHSLDIAFDDIFVVSQAVAVAPEGFTAWREQQFPDAAGDDAISGPGADPDGDGIPNLLEYVLGGDPNVPNRGIAPSVDVTGVDGVDYLRLEYHRDPDAVGVDLVVERSSDLVEWTPIAGPESAEAANGLVHEVWIDEQAIDSENRGFLRLRVELSD